MVKFVLWASEVVFDSEVHGVSEVSPCGEVVAEMKKRAVDDRPFFTLKNTCPLMHMPKKPKKIAKSIKFFPFAY